MSLLRKVGSVSTVTNTKRVLRCLVVWVVVVLVSFDVSTATWSPHAHPQQSHHTVNANKNNHKNIDKNIDINNSVSSLARGGSTILQPPPPPPPLQGEQQHQGSEHYHHHQQQKHQQQQLGTRNQGHNKNPHSFIPKIGLKQVAKALLHTTEWNRRLLRGVKHWGIHRSQLLSSSSSSNHNYYHGSLYGNLPVNVHPSRTWEPTIQASSGRFLEDEELSLFHAKNTVRSTRACGPDERDRDTDDDVRHEHRVHANEHDDDRGVGDWGPDLLPYLEHIADLLGIDVATNDDDDDTGQQHQRKHGVEIVLAMIYLDRACSVETPRSNGVPPCPFCTPRTVHRLSLAAMVLSSAAVRASPSQRPAAANHGESDEQQQLLSKLSLSLGIPPAQLQHMVEWMKAALGDEGMYVTPEEMRSWSRSWEAFFSSATPSANNE